MIFTLLDLRFSQSFITIQAFLGNPWGKNSITVSDDICNILPQGMDNGIAQFVSRESGKLNLMFILRL